MSEVTNLRRSAVSHRAMADFLDQQASQIESKVAELGLEQSGLAPVAVDTTKPKKSTKKTVAKKAATTGQRGRGRPPGSRNKPKDGETGASSANRTNPQSLRALILSILEKSKDGLDLKTIAKMCVDAGYVSNTKGNFSNMVYQNLYKLMTAEKTVKKDDKIYKLVSAPAA